MDDTTVEQKANRSQDGREHAFRSIIGSFGGHVEPERMREDSHSALHLSHSQISGGLLKLRQELSSQQVDDPLVELAHPRLGQAESASYLVERLALLVAEVQDSPVPFTKGMPLPGRDAQSAALCSAARAGSDSTSSSTGSQA